jgi:hypothetical protein
MPCASKRKSAPQQWWIPNQFRLDEPNDFCESMPQHPLRGYECYRDFSSVEGLSPPLIFENFPVLQCAATSRINWDSNFAAGRPAEESMFRHSFLMAVSLASCLFVSAKTFGQRTRSIGPTPIDVLYLVNQNTTDADTIETYNVDPGYGDATLAGTFSVRVPLGLYCSLVPGANDHYVYFFCAYGAKGSVLQVYATDSNGAPQDPAIQTINFKMAISQFLIDPNGTLAYATQQVQGVQDVVKVGILALAVDPKTGMVTVPTSFIDVETAPIDCSPRNPFGPPSFGLIEFNVSGSQLIDAWGCSGHGDGTNFFFTQDVNQETGSLGWPVPTVGSGYSNDEYSSVSFTPTAIFSFINYGYDGSRNELDVYWPNAKLDFSCTMFDACAYSGGITTDRTGRFIFFYTNAGGTEVTRLNMDKKTIEPVGIPLANTIETFSFDDRLIYGDRTLSWNGEYVIPVYVFNPGTGLVTSNGMEITMPSEYSSLIPALRY